MAFDKFLKGLEEAPTERSEPKANGEVHKRVGRPPLPDADRKYPKRITERHQPNGRIKRGEWKGRGAYGHKHYKARRKTQREAMRKARTKRGLDYERKYNATLRRKYIQNRNKAHHAAKRRSVDPELYYQISYEQWLLIWAEAPDVFHEDKWQRPAAIANNPVLKSYNCCYFRRIDETRAFTMDNVAVFYRHKPLRK